jgi:hypothetical protein
MHWTAHPPRSLSTGQAAAALLGNDHPLVLVARRLDMLAGQSLVVAAVLSASIVVLVAGVSAASALVVASAVVQATLAGAVALLADRKRELALDLIIEGRGNLPLLAIERQRRRLLDDGHRQGLARWLDAGCREAEHPIQRPAFARPLYSARLVAAVAPDLAEIARLLRSENPGQRGVAKTQRLLRDGTSALYGRDGDLLREELHRIRFLIES